jgi:hypothetical protein
MSQILNLMDIRLVGAAPLHADRKTDMTKLICAFRDYAETSKSCRIQQYQLLV